ncbi:MAG: hypothetical protein ACE5DI_03250 [Candidatus Micrarchaeia archaeon]
MVLQVIQFAGGSLLFVATGYALTLAFFEEKDLDVLEQVVFSLAFAMIIPTLLLMFATMVLSLKLDSLSVYAAYIVVGGGAYAYHVFKSGKKIL